MKIPNAVGGWCHYDLECRDKDGNLKWSESIDNLITTVGLNDMVSNYWKGAAYTAAFFVGLTSGSPTPAVGDTMSSHAGWTEVEDYVEATREALTLGAVSGGSASNTASKATFSINATVTIGGAFITTDDTIGATDGTLVSVAAFESPGNRSAVSGDTIAVTVTCSFANPA